MLYLCFMYCKLRFTKKKQTARYAISIKIDGFQMVFYDISFVLNDILVKCKSHMFLNILCVCVFFTDERAICVFPFSRMYDACYAFYVDIFHIV